MSAAWRVRDAAHLGLSIDNVIHQQRDDPLFAWCAKLAIAQIILTAESKSDLRVHDNSMMLSWPKVRGTWLGGFAQLLVQDLERRQIEKIFDNITVISFNYDRTILRFLPMALASQYAIDQRKAEELCNRLRIVHPYGALGALPISLTQNAIPYGCQSSSLATVAGNLRTFTEQVEDDKGLVDIQEMMSNATRVVFLGFGYLSQNMELLRRDVVGSARQIFGTSYGLSEPDQILVKNQLSYLFPETMRAYKEAQLSPLKCFDFIRENFRTLTS